MNQNLIKKSINLQGHSTSIALEADFWQALEQEAKRRNFSLAKLISSLEAADPSANLASSLRLHCFNLAKAQAKSAQSLQGILDVMARLRDKQQGCPWDLEQDFKSLIPFTLEEAYEVADAIKNGDMAEIKDELGDLLFQIVFYAQMGKELGNFDFAAICDHISNKMILRHPHIWQIEKPSNGLDDAQKDAIQIKANWEVIKAEERSLKYGENTGVLSGIAKGLPALMRAQKLVKRAGRVGFIWDKPFDAFDKVQEELEELKVEMNRLLEKKQDKSALGAEFGDCLFSIVSLGFMLGLDSETQLSLANHKFQARFEFIEAEMQKNGQVFEDIDLAKMDEYWNSAKMAGL